MVLCLLCQRHIIQVVRQMQTQMQALFCSTDMGLQTQTWGQGLQQCLSALCIRGAGLTDGALEMTELDEFSHRHLLMQQARTVQVVMGAFERRHPVWGHHHIRHLDAGVQGFGKSPHVKHAVLQVQRMQRRLLWSGKTELAVIVVFQGPGVHVATTSQQIQAPLWGQHTARGVLVRRRDVDHACSWRLVRQRQVQALGIGGYAMHAQPTGSKHLCRTPIQRVFHPHRVARVGQQDGAQAQGLLGACGHQHLLLLQTHAAKQAQVLGNRPLEGFEATGVVVIKHAGIRQAPVFGQ